MCMVSTTNTITNITNQLLTNKIIKKWFSVVCFGTYSIRIGFNKPHGDQLPVENPQFCNGVYCFFFSRVICGYHGLTIVTMFFLFFLFVVKAWLVCKGAM